MVMKRLMVIATGKLFGQISLTSNSSRPSTRGIFGLQVCQWLWRYAETIVVRFGLLNRALILIKL